MFPRLLKCLGPLLVTKWSKNVGFPIFEDALSFFGLIYPEQEDGPHRWHRVEHTDITSNHETAPLKPETPQRRAMFLSQGKKRPSLAVTMGYIIWFELR